MNFDFNKTESSSYEHFTEAVENWQTSNSPKGKNMWRKSPEIFIFYFNLSNCLISVKWQYFIFCRCNNENEWYQIHENIIRKSSNKYTAPSNNYGKSLFDCIWCINLLFYRLINKIIKAKPFFNSV